jgi:hypothetical protein
MRRFASLLLCSLVCLFAACGPKAIDTQAQMANTIAVVTNDVVPQLIALEHARGDAIIDAAPDKATAVRELALLEQSWKPVWQAQKALTIAQNAWATALEQHGDTTATFQAVRTAYCRLLPLLPRTVNVPAVAGLLCEVSDAGY